MRTNGENPPCFSGGKDCEKRSAHCHMNCTDYASYTAKMLAVKSAKTESHIGGEYIYAKSLNYRRGIK